jgi:hypothetical protein
MEAPSITRHNRATYANQGCRCEVCTEANTVYARARRAGLRLDGAAS